MKLPKEFEYYLQKKIVKKQAPDKPRAEFLIKEANLSIKGLNNRIKAVQIDEFNSNSIIKDCYDIIMGLIRAKLLLNGYSTSGSYAHEGEISYLKMVGFTDNKLSFLNELKYFRNSINYYGKILDEEYAKKVYSFLLEIFPNLNAMFDELQDENFVKHKANFFSFLNKIDKNENIGIIAHANCVDGMSSVVFMVEILKKKYPSIKTNVVFLAYKIGGLEGLQGVFNREKIKKVFVLDLNVDMDLLDEFENFRKNFDVFFIDHHPLNDKLILNENVIKTRQYDCTALSIFRFGEDLIDHNQWSWLACVAAISEFSDKNEKNVKFIQKYYPDFDPENRENSIIFKKVVKMNSLVVYYSKDSLKAYKLILNNDSSKIDLINEEVSSEMDRCLKDFEDNADAYFNRHLLLYFFKSKFSLGSTFSTVASLKYRGSTIGIFSEIEGSDLVKFSGRNNFVPLKYSINNMVRAGIAGLSSAIGGGHAPASGASFLKKDLEIFKKQIIEFVGSKLKGDNI